MDWLGLVAIETTVFSVFGGGGVTGLPVSDSGPMAMHDDDADELSLRPEKPPNLYH